jgi:anthranilate phosphoribosyltransferase
MRKAAIHLDHPYDVIDVCGTGGDGLHTLNISTAVGFVAAGGGLKVAKHGNRAITSKSGTADVLAALGVNIEATLEQQRKALDEAGICFLFAQAHHGAMRHVSPIRQQLGFRTIFNLLGPLSNPAGAKRQVVGVPSPRFVEPIAQALGQLGATKAWSVHGSGLDELTTTGETDVAEWKDGFVRLFKITPEAVGLPRAALADITGGAPEYNAAELSDLLDGKTGAYRDIVMLNAAAAFLVADTVETLREGVELAANIIDDGRARSALDTLIATTKAS